MFNLTNLKFKVCTKAGETLNLPGMKPWLSIRQGDALTGVPIVLTDVFCLLIVLISYVNSCTVLKPYLTHTRKL